MCAIFFIITSLMLASVIAIEEHNIDLVTPIKSIGEACGYESCPDVVADVINVHVVPHTHAELGLWTHFDRHFDGKETNDYTVQVNMKRIFDAVITELWRDASRTFTIADFAYFFHWWKQRDGTVRRMVYELIRQGRLYFVSGGWSISDEASISYQALIDQHTYTLRKLNNTFLDCGRPLVAWQAECSGHSREVASLLAQMGYDGLFINPISYDDELLRMKNRGYEFLWRGSDELGPESDIFTHKLFDGFNSPPGFCFGALCYDPLIVKSSYTFNNVDEVVSRFIKSMLHRQAPHFRTKHLLVMMGEKLAYHDAERWFANIDALIVGVNSAASPSGPKLRMYYSSVGCYLRAVHAVRPVLPTKQDDFLPFQLDRESFLVGAYTSRPRFKYHVTMANIYLQMTKQLQVLARLGNNDAFYEEMNWIVGVTNDHHILAGAMTEPVLSYYSQRLYLAIQKATLVTKQAFNKIRGSQSTMYYFRCSFNHSTCPNIDRRDSFVVIYNPLAWPVRIPVRLPIFGRDVAVYSSTGIKIPASTMKIPTPVLSIPRRNTKSKTELIFMATLPALGFRSYYLQLIRYQLVRKKRSLVKMLKKGKKQKFLMKLTKEGQEMIDKDLNATDNEETRVRDHEIEGNYDEAEKIQDGVEKNDEHIEKNYDDIERRSEKKTKIIFADISKSEEKILDVITPRNLKEDGDSKYEEIMDELRAFRKQKTPIADQTETAGKFEFETATNVESTLATPTETIADSIFKLYSITTSPPMTEATPTEVMVEHTIAESASTTKMVDRTTDLTITEPARTESTIFEATTTELSVPEPITVTSQVEEVNTHSTAMPREENYYEMENADVGTNKTRFFKDYAMYYDLGYKYDPKQVMADFANKERESPDTENAQQSYDAPADNDALTSNDAKTNNDARSSNDAPTSNDASSINDAQATNDNQTSTDASSSNDGQTRTDTKAKNYTQPKKYSNYGDIYVRTNDDLRDIEVKIDEFVKKNSFYYYKESTDDFIENKYLTLKIQKRTGLVRSVELANGMNMSLDIQIYYYVSDEQSTSSVPRGEERAEPRRNPGIYLFRTFAKSAQVVKSYYAETNIYKSRLVEEVHMKFSKYASLAIRLYRNTPNLEVDWLVGPPPENDFGREFFIRYKTDLSHKGVFYTDANGRQTVKRIRNRRPTYEPLNIDLVAGNIYPVTSKIYIEDVQKNIRFSVLNDRSQGGTSLYDGEIDLFLMRSIYTDDKVTEAEIKDIDIDSEAMVRGTHYLVISEATQNANKIYEKKLAKEVALKPQVFASPANMASNFTLTEWLAYTNHFSGLQNKLPLGVHLLTLQEWNDGALLLRLENYLETGDAKKPTKTVFLHELFKDLTIRSIKETTLSANKLLEDWTPLQWEKENQFLYNMNDFFESGNATVANDGTLRPVEELTPGDGIELGPQQIRTFVIQYTFDEE